MAEDATDDAPNTAPDDRARTAARSARAWSCRASMDKTAVVAVIERVRHARYAKTVQRTKRLYAHDEENDRRASATGSASPRPGRSRS